MKQVSKRIFKGSLLWVVFWALVFWPFAIWYYLHKSEVITEAYNEPTNE